MQAYFRETVGLVPDHCNKVSITIKRVTQIFWFPNAKKVKVMFTPYCSLVSVQQHMYKKKVHAALIIYC